MATILHMHDKFDAIYTRSSNVSILKMRNVCLYHSCFSIAPLELGCCSSLAEILSSSGYTKAFTKVSKRRGYDSVSLVNKGLFIT